MSSISSGFEDAFGFAGIGRWECALDGETLRLDDVCRELFELTKNEALSRDVIMERIAEHERDRVFSALDLLVREGQEFDETFKLVLPSGRERWLRGVAKFRSDSGGDMVMGVSFDVTSEQKLLAERDLHLAEINHRIKNLFALVAAMISSASRESSDKDEVVTNLRDRVTALDRAHSLMLKTDASRPIPLEALLSEVLAPAHSRQTIIMSGSKVLIPAKAITLLVLIFHEWVTNSAKYGALRHTDGTINVEWSPYDGGVDIHWRELVPDYDVDAEKGFGSRLIQASAMQLKAEKVRRFEGGWLCIDMRLPLDDY
ncbi:PAS domain-containing protein [Sulfitobacter sp. BDSS02]|uniref:sensor histidine kinase n=1 Tax=Heliomarina sp. TaxID=2917556 RepID=UPI004059C628|nr:PAS domain-containing protein [Sulfitobacter sp. BDSS02]MBR9852535.1 PAS domain-containing protein [Paracoccaceae bacterium]